jgi:hypothetical protein
MELDDMRKFARDSQNFRKLRRFIDRAIFEIAGVCRVRVYLAFAVERDKARDPNHRRNLGAEAVVLEP